MDQALGPFRLIEELGTGGMGTVFLGESPEGERVALKLIHPHLLASPSFFQRFVREAEIGKLVKHPNVVQTIDVNIAEEKGDTAHYLVMEYVEGQTLRALLEELGQVPEELCRHVGHEIAGALAAIHGAGVVHRDLKPENVLITEDHVVKVMDLGVARLVDEAIRLSQTGAFAGSVLYAAPEQFRGGEPDPRSDLYSLGLMLYELAAGKHPSGGEDFVETMQRRLNEQVRPASAVNPQISVFFEEVLQTLLSRNIEERFSSAVELAETLEQGEKSDWWGERAQSLRARRERPARQIHIPRETGLHGRDEELESLHGLYLQAREGRGQVALVEGEAGIGKTRLADEFVRLLREQGEEIHFLFGSFPPGGSTTAAGAFATAFCEHFGREGLEQTLRHYLRQTPMLIPAFSALLRGEPAPDGQQPLERDSIQTVFVHAARALAKERPTVILVDDLQLASDEGRALFSALSLVAAEHRLLLLGASRPPLPESFLAGLDRLAHSTRLSLPRLGPKGLARVLIDAFGSERLAQELGLQIAQKSDGNPFFVFEIIRGLREGKFIRCTDDGSWVRTQVIEQIQIPSSVLDLIQARIAELEEQDKDLLDVASCCGFEFDPLLVAAAVGMDQIPAMKRFARIEKKHRLIRSSGRTCVFDHHQIQEALYTGMPELLREPYHATLGQVLEEREGAGERDPSEVGGALCAELADHFLKGGQGDHARRYVEPALDHLERNYLNDAAVRLADRALAATGVLSDADRVSILLRKVDRLELLGRRQEEREVIDKALHVAERTQDAGLRSETLLLFGTHLIHQADYSAAQERAEQALALARQAGDLKLESAAESLLGSVWHHLGIYSRAHEHHERTLELAREIGDREEEARAALNLSSIFSELGQTARAREHIDRALIITRETGNRRWEAIARGNLGLLDLRTGDYAEARRHLDKCLMISHETGARAGVADAIGNLGVVFRAMGRLQEARQHFERHLALSREISSRLGEASALTGLGMVNTEMAEAISARDLLEQALTASREIGVRRAEGFAIHGLGRLAELLGDHKRATRRYEEAHAVIHELGNRRDEAGLLIDLGRMQMAADRGAEARPLIEEAYQIASDLEHPSCLVHAGALRARLDPGKVADALTALKKFEERSEHMPRMRARFVLWQATGDRAHLEEAYRLLAALRRYAPEPLKNAMISKVPWHREIVVAGKEQGL